MSGFILGLLIGYHLSQPHKHYTPSFHSRDRTIKVPCNASCDQQGEQIIKSINKLSTDMWNRHRRDFHVQYPERWDHECPNLKTQLDRDVISLSSKEQNFYVSSDHAAGTFSGHIMPQYRSPFLEKDSIDPPWGETKHYRITMTQCSETERSLLKFRSAIKDHFSNTSS